MTIIVLQPFLFLSYNDLMRCPRCQTQEFNLAASCPACAFTGDARLLERLSNLTFLLQESQQWEFVSLRLQEQMEQYARQRRAVEVDLGVRPPPPDAVEAQALRQEYRHLRALRKKLSRCFDWGWITRPVYRELQDSIHQKQRAIDARLIDAPPTPPPSTPLKTVLAEWEEKRFILDTLARLQSDGEISGPGFELESRTLEAELLELEYQAGLRQRPQPPVDRPITPPPDPPSAAPSVPPRQPWSWDRFWESLLSERTLQAILFLGAMLLFAAGLSWVAWNWDTFPPLVQVIFLAAFTAFFYGLGWYVHRRMALPGSGIALTAVASLLLPLDFYAYYLSGGFPPESWPQVWLLASLVCLLAYTFTAFVAPADFFAYLVAIAAGSLAIATLNLLDVHPYWWPAGVTAVALALALASEGLPRGPAATRFLAAPFGRMALATAPPVLALGMGWTLFGAGRNPVFVAATALSWWLGALTLLLMAPRYRLKSLDLATALCFPVAVWLTQRWLFLPASVHWGWHGVGWALLAPVYWLIAYRLAQGKEEWHDSAAQTARQGGWLLLIVAALVSLGQVRAVMAVHPVLAATLIVGAWLWQRPVLLWPASLLLMTASAAYQGARGAAPPELALPWALLSIGHIVAGLLLRRPGKTATTDAQPAVEDGLTAPLFGAGVLIGALAVLPPLLLWDQPLLVYALAHWIGLNGWLANLAHSREAPGLVALLARPRWRLLGPLWFQWGSALALVPWLAIALTNGRPFATWMPLAFVLLAWSLLWLCRRLQRLSHTYGAPWMVAAHLSNLAALATTSLFFEQPWTAAVLLAVAAFYFLVAYLRRESEWLYAGGVLFPVGWLLALEWIGLPPYLINPALALAALAYLVAVRILELRRHVESDFLLPLRQVLLLLSVVAFGWLVLDVARYWSSPQLSWVATAPLLLGVLFGLYTWHLKQPVWAHVAVWSLTLAGGLWVVTFSRGSGRSAAMIAAMAVVFVLLERTLRYLALARPRIKAQFARQAWRLYRLPLLQAGWTLSAAAIVAALWRNMMWLGGGPTRQTWAVVALLLIVALYALAARLFRRPRFAWLAALLIPFPWTLLADLGWYLLPRPSLHWHAVSWLILAGLLLGTGALLAQRCRSAKWSRPPLLVAHLLAPLALLLALQAQAVAIWALPLAILYYLAAVAVDFAFRPKEGLPGAEMLPSAEALPRARFLYPAAFLTPLWVVYLVQYVTPEPISGVTTGLLLMTFTLPALFLGRWLAGRQPSYRWPFYLLAYSTAAIAMPLVAYDWRVLTGIFLFNAGLATYSVWLFRQPLWWYPAALLLPWAVMTWLGGAGVGGTHYYGWAVIGLAAVYLAGAWLLRRRQQDAYATPLMAMMFFWSALGLLPASPDRVGALVGYSAVSLLYLITAVWRRQPIVMSVAAGLALVPYAMAMLLLNVPPSDYGLALWPGILVALLLARHLDDGWGKEPNRDGSKVGDFPWTNPMQWPDMFTRYWERWWAWPWYGVVCLGVVLSATLSISTPWRWLVTLLLGTAVFAWLAVRFRLRGWLFAAAAWFDLAALAFMRQMGWTAEPDQIALAFLPLTAVTAIVALSIEQVRGEGPPLQMEGPWFRFRPDGWSRPLYLLLALNLFVGQLLAVTTTSAAGTIVTSGHALILLVITTAWQLPLLAPLPLLLGLLALMLAPAWRQAAGTSQIVSVAVMAAAYGVGGYTLHSAQVWLQTRWAWLLLWRRPLQFGGWILSIAVWLLALQSTNTVLALTVRYVFLTPVHSVAELRQVEMFILVSAVLGLFYLAAALAERWRWLGYGALVLLLSAWSLWLLIIQGQRELQYYALPVGAYLLAAGWFEWQFGSRAFARWLDRAALALLFGSLFWQSLGAGGAVYALAMIGEGLLVAWLGSLRRLRRLLYAGMVGVFTAVAGQLIEPLLALDTLVLLLLGALLLALGIGLERRLEKMRELSQELRLKLEEWD
jgi:hypothetical protein